MSDPFDDSPTSRPEPSQEPENQPVSGDFDSADQASQDTSTRTSMSQADEVLQSSVSETPTARTTLPSEEGYPTFTESLEGTDYLPEYTQQKGIQPKSVPPLAMVETAFLASTGSLIWLINYYFPLGPVLRIFFPVPIALVYLRWGNRASWMAALVSGLLLSVLMGPTRSILFFIPFGLMGVQLGAMWRRQTNWYFSIFAGMLLGTIGFFFRFWLLSLLLGEDLWVYVMTQFTELTQWGFARLGLLAQPDLMLIQAIAVIMVVISNIVYLFVVHLVALLVLDRLGNPIPRPPHWVEVLLDYE